MIPDDVRPVLESLAARSRKREVEWLPSSAAGHRFGDYVVIFPTSSIVIGEDQDSSVIEGKILNQRGDTVLSFWTRPDDADYDFVAELLELARRKVVRADETLAEIRKALESSQRVGEEPRPKKPTNVIDDDEEVPF